MRNTMDIDDPTWHDIFDRDKEIDRLRAEIERLRSANAELGVCVSTGYGGGQYPVEVRYSDEGRVAELRVTFIPEGDEVEPLPDDVVAALDPGVRDLVVALRQQGFETTDSGDGESEPEDHRDLDYPHVFVVVPVTRIAEEARRLQEWVDADGHFGGWTVEATYSPKDGVALLHLSYFNP